MRTLPDWFIISLVISSSTISVVYFVYERDWIGLNAMLAALFSGFLLAFYIMGGSDDVS